MAIAQVGNWTSGQFNNNTGGSLTGRTSVAGNFIAAAAFSSDNTATISDSKSNVYSSWATGWKADGTAGYFERLFYKENAAGGLTHTISLATVASSFSVLCATEYSGIAASSSLDKEASNTGLSTSLSSGATAATTQADELVIGFGEIQDAGNTAFTATGGYTMRGSITDGVNGGLGFLEDLIVASTGAQTATATHANNNQWVMGVVTFKGAAAADSPTIGDWRQLVPAWQRQRRRPNEKGSQPKPYYPATAAASADVSVSGFLPAGMVVYSDATHDAAVTGLLPATAAAYSTVTHTASVVAHLSAATVLYGALPGDVSVVGYLPVGMVPYGLIVPTQTATGHLAIGAMLRADATHATDVAGHLPAGLAPYSTISHAADVAGHLPAGLVPYSTISHAATVTGLLPAAALPYSTVSHTANVAGFLPTAATIWAVIAGATDVSVVGYLAVGMAPYATASHAATVAGLLPAALDLRATASHAANVTGLLPTAASLWTPASHTANTTGLLPVAANIVADVVHRANASGLIIVAMVPTGMYVGAIVIIADPYPFTDSGRERYTADAMERNVSASGRRPYTSSATESYYSSGKEPS